MQNVMQSHYLLPACQSGRLFESRVLILESIISYIGRLIVWNLNRNYFFQFFVAAQIYPYVFSSFHQLLCINLFKWTYYKKNHKNTPPLCFHERRILYRGKIIKLNTPHHSHSHHIQSLCLLKQLAHQNRRLMIRQFMLHPRWWHLVEILYFSLTQWNCERNGRWGF